MAVTREQVAEIYVATFNRAPDSAGLDYWAGTTLAIEQIAQSFFEQDETKEKYPDTLSNSLFVDEVYNNVYNRSGDPEGAAYWIEELSNGTTRDVMIIAMVNGAQGTDQDTLDNKVEVGLYFAEKGTLLSYDQSIEVMADVTNDDQTVVDAIAEVDAWSAAVQTIPLTIEIDTIVGTDLDNTITALVATDPADSTLNPEDTINGGGGDNRLALTNEAAAETTTLLSHMSSVATLAYTNSATGVQTIDMAGTTGVQTIEMHGGSDVETIFANVVNIVDLELSGASTATRIEYTAAAVIGDDTMNITNSSTETQVVRVEGIETINLTSDTAAGVENSIVLLDADLIKIAVDGAGAMMLHGANIDGDGDANIIDLSAATGNITVMNSIVDINGATITSGGGKDTIDLNDGDDDVIYTLAAQSHFANSDILLNFNDGGSNDIINLTVAIEVAGGSATYEAVTAAEFSDNGSALDENQNMTTVTRGAGTTYYIDADSNNIYNAAIDMMINIDALILTEADFIV